MKKRATLLLTAVILSSQIFAGCGNQKSDESAAVSISNSSLLSASSASGASTSTAYPLTIQTRGSDFISIDQTFEKVPERIVTANASSIDMLYRLGLQDKIIGTIAIDNEPGNEWADLYESLPKLGDKMTISKEVIAEAEPDIIIGRSATFEEGTFGSIVELNALGINVYAQKASDMSTAVTMESIIDDVRNLGEIFDVQDRAKEYADSLENRLSTVTKTVRDATGTDIKKVVVMATYQEGNFVVFGANAKLQNGILQTLNAENVMEKGGNGLTLENLVSANPDAIIYITSTRNKDIDVSAKEALLNESLLSSVPAIADKKIIEVPYDAFMDYGVRNFDTLEELADFLYNK